MSLFFSHIPTNNIISNKLNKVAKLLIIFSHLNILLSYKYTHIFSSFLSHTSKVKGDFLKCLTLRDLTFLISYHSLRFVWRGNFYYFLKLITIQTSLSFTCLYLSIIIYKFCCESFEVYRIVSIFLQSIESYLQYNTNIVSQHTKCEKGIILA